MKEKAVVVYSGGMGSFTLLHKIRKQGFEVFALSFDYGQRHAVELKVASEVCRRNGIKHKVVDISSCLLYTSPSPRDATLSRMPSSA